MYNKNHLIRGQECSKNLDSQISHLVLNSPNCTGLKLKPSPLRLVLERTILRGVVTRDSSPPLNMPCVPQSSESQAFPLPVLPYSDIPEGGRLAHFVEQMGPLDHLRWFQDIVQVKSPSFVSSDKSESVLLPITRRRECGTFPETPALVAHLDAPSDWRPGGYRFIPPPWSASFFCGA